MTGIQPNGGNGALPTLTLRSAMATTACGAIFIGLIALKVINKFSCTFSGLIALTTTITFSATVLLFGLALFSSISADNPRISADNQPEDEGSQLLVPFARYVNNIQAVVGKVLTITAAAIASPTKTSDEVIEES